MHSAFIFACFAFVLSQTCLVLLKYVLVLQLCRHNDLVGPVLIKRLYVFRLCRHKRKRMMVLFNCLHVSLAFVLSQTLCGFCLIDCIFCLCPYKRMVCSFYMFAYFAFLSQTYLVF